MSTRKSAQPGRTPTWAYYPRKDIAGNLKVPSGRRDHCEVEGPEECLDIDSTRNLRRSQASSTDSQRVPGSTVHSEAGIKSHSIRVGKLSVADQTKVIKTTALADHLNNLGVT
jgi:hypothetical protein